MVFLGGGWGFVWFFFFGGVGFFVCWLVGFFCQA